MLTQSPSQFFRPGTSTQLVIGLVICAATLQVYNEARPFSLTEDNRVAIMAQWQLFFMCVCAPSPCPTAGPDDLTLATAVWRPGSSPPS